MNLIEQAKEHIQDAALDRMNTETADNSWCALFQEFVPRLVQRIEELEQPELFPILQVGDYKLDPRSFQLTSPRGSVNLTRVQFDLLRYLMSHEGQAISVDRLLQEVWDYPPGAGSSDLVRVHIRGLRMKIEVDPTKPDFIKTVRGHGYIVVPPTKERSDG